MQYRILESLRYLNSSKRLKVGTITDLRRLSSETIELLLAKNRIAEVVPPPLAVIPGFEERAVEYEKQGILSVNDMTGDEEDFEEVKAWSTGEYDSPDATPDFFSQPVGGDVFEVTKDVILEQTENGNNSIS